MCKTRTAIAGNGQSYKVVGNSNVSYFFPLNSLFIHSLILHTNILHTNSYITTSPPSPTQPSYLPPPPGLPPLTQQNKQTNKQRKKTR